MDLGSPCPSSHSCSQNYYSCKRRRSKGLAYSAFAKFGRFAGHTCERAARAWGFLAQSYNSWFCAALVTLQRVFDAVTSDGAGQGFSERLKCVPTTLQRRPITQSLKANLVDSNELPGWYTVFAPWLGRCRVVRLRLGRQGLAWLDKAFLAVDYVDFARRFEVVWLEPGLTLRRRRPMVSSASRGAAGRR